MGAPTGRLARRTPGPRPVQAVQRLAGTGPGRQAAATAGHGAGHGYTGRLPVGADGAAAWRERTRLRLLHQLPEPQGRGIARESARGTGPLLGGAGSANP